MKNSDLYSYKNRIHSLFSHHHHSHFSIVFLPDRLFRWPKRPFLHHYSWSCVKIKGECWVDVGSKCGQCRVDVGSMGSMCCRCSVGDV